VFPSFISPSLKTLTLDYLSDRLFESLLRQLPTMLQASGARLEEMHVLRATETSAESAAALAQVLRTCSPALKSFRILSANRHKGVFDSGVASEVTSGLVSCCEGLERLDVPWGTFKSLPLPYPTFTRLTHLNIFKGPFAVTDPKSPVWDLMASGLLPALTDLSVHYEGFSCGTGEPWECRLARALEGVAGTLRRLTLKSGSPPHNYPAVEYHELGVAIGKLRCLSYLSLSLCTDGRAYLAMGRGLAASGGCPKLFELHLDQVKWDIECIAYKPSLIVPSVRHLHIQVSDRKDEDVLLLCCGLVVLGYRHRLTHNLHRAETYFPCVAAILKAGGIQHTEAKQSR
jgi:hypothetical protein